jgi:hypothetical protein
VSIHFQEFFDGCEALEVVDRTSNFNNFVLQLKTNVLFNL